MGRAHTSTFRLFLASAVAWTIATSTCCRQTGAAELVIRVYDVRDLVDVAGDYTPPPAIERVDPNEPDHQILKEAEARDQRLTTLAQDIRKAVPISVPAGTSENEPSMMGIEGQLIVQDTAENQTKIAALLEKLRVPYQTQISLETGIFLVNSAMLQEIARDCPHLKASDKPELKDATGDLISEAQTTAILNKITSDKSTTRLNAPRLTLFDQQKGYVGITQPLQFVSGIKVVEANDVTSTNLEVSRLNSGLNVVLKATASANQKTVNVHLEMEDRTLVRIDQEDIPNASSPREKLFVQKPVLAIYRMNTAADIPDGGQLLIGGIKVSDHEAPEAKYLLLIVRPKIIVQKEIDAAGPNK